MREWIDCGKAGIVWRHVLWCHLYDLKSAMRYQLFIAR
jgi:hypothetical protein